MTADLPASVARRTRLRRAAALGGLLAATVVPVWVRAAASPAPTRALGTGLAAGPGDPQPAPSPAAAHGGTAATVRTATGSAYDVRYGTVRVRVRMVGSRLVDVTAVTLPAGGRSSDISAYAAPMLRREALAAQSADIDTVSGASYTSAGYARSLQSALDRAGRG